MNLGIQPNGALISVDGKYRWQLWRSWDSSLPAVCFIMLNPSTADATTNDATIRRCITFAKSWGYGGVVVVNLFAYRATDPRELNCKIDAVGEINDSFINDAVHSTDLIVCAWGSKMPFGHYSRPKDMRNVLRGFTLHAIKVNKDGNPAHPLYLSGSLKPQRYDL